MPVAAILIATRAEAGGERPLPAELPWNDSDETLIEWEIRQLRLAGIRDVVVVLGRAADEIIPLVVRDNVEPIVDERWATGPASALRAGAAAVPRGTGAAIVGYADEPRPASVYRSLVDAWEGTRAPAVRPTHAGQPGTPVLIDAQVLAALRNLPDGAGGLEGLLGRGTVGVVDVPFDSPVVLFRATSSDDLAAFVQRVGE